MTEPTLFDYDYFMSLSGEELTAYAEPSVNVRPEAIPEHVYDSLHAALESMDELHTVYAIEICMFLRPDAFINHAIEFLAHSSGSVCCAAVNSIKRAPRESITSDIVKKIKATPIIDIFSQHVRTGERIRLGTNEELIRGLAEAFARGF